MLVGMRERRKKGRREKSPKNAQQIELGTTNSSKLNGRNEMTSRVVKNTHTMNLFCDIQMAWHVHFLSRQ